MRELRKKTDNIIDLKARYEENSSQIISKLTDRIVKLEKDIRDLSQNKVSLPCKEGFLLMNLDQIYYLESSGSYTKIYLDGGRQVLISKTLKTLIRAFPLGRFIRTHQSFLVNSDHVDKLVKQHGAYILLQNNKQIPISRSKKDAVYDWFNKLYC